MRKGTITVLRVTEFVAKGAANVDEKAMADISKDDPVEEVVGKIIAENTMKELDIKIKKDDDDQS